MTDVNKLVQQNLVSSVHSSITLCINANKKLLFSVFSYKPNSKMYHKPITLTVFMEVLCLALQRIVIFNMPSLGSDLRGEALLVLYASQLLLVILVASEVIKYLQIG